jgi:flagellar basal-body rod modification protein FlgD
MATAVASINGMNQGIAAKTSNTIQEQQDRFLKLLVTQMKNQDPLNPLDNAQVTTQMAQLSTVTGIEKLNATLEAFTRAQAFQAVGLIGHHVLAPGEFVNLNGGAGVGGFELPSAADSVKVSIFDASGNLVRRLDLGDQNEGVSVFQWDGKTDAGEVAPDGAYGFTVAASINGNAVLSEPLAVGAVQSVLMDGIGPALSVQGMGLVDLSQVKQIL